MRIKTPNLYFATDGKREVGEAPSEQFTEASIASPGFFYIWA